MCGTVAAIGLEEHERELWPILRDRLRQPGRLMALMRGVLGGDAEVAAVVTVTPQGIVRPIAILATPVIADEVTLLDDPPPDPAAPDLRPGRIGDDDVTVLLAAPPGQPPRVAAVLVTDWMREHLSLYARELWHRRR